MSNSDTKWFADGKTIPNIESHTKPDPSLKGFVNEEKINHWLYTPTIEKWN